MTEEAAKNDDRTTDPAAPAAEAQAPPTAVGRFPFESGDKAKLVKGYETYGGKEVTVRAVVGDDRYDVETSDGIWLPNVAADQIEDAV